MSSNQSINDIAAKSLGSDNIAYAETLNNLAALYTGIQDYENAEKYYLISLAIFFAVIFLLNKQPITPV